MKKKAQKILALLVLLVGGYFFNEKQNNTSQNNSPAQTLEQRYKQGVSGKIITFKAQVVKILADDNDGDRHQKMILKSASHTILLAHNIDVAKRVPAKKGDTLELRGQYEWNKKGGVIHWTHRDKNNKHPHGWIKHNNKTYQ